MAKKKVTKKETMAIQALFDNGFSDKRAAMDKANYAKDTHPNKVFDRPSVKLEIAGRQKALARRHDINQDKIIEELIKVGFHGVGDLIQVDKLGNATLDFTKLTDAHRAGIKSFTTKVYTDGKGPGAKEVKETKIEFISKLTALEAISKHLGLFEKDDSGSKDLIDALLRARKRIRIQIDDDPDG